MPKVEQHDLSEYYITLHDVPILTATSVDLLHIPIPKAGQIRRVYVTAADIDLDIDTPIQFYTTNSNRLFAGGVESEMTLLAADAKGDTHVLFFDPVAGENFVRETEDGDGLTSGALIRVVKNGPGNSALSAYTFTFVIRP